MSACYFLGINSDYEFLLMAFLKNRHRLCLWAVIICICCLAACSRNDSGVEKVKPQRVINAISDTIFLSSQVSNLTCFDGKYYLSDYYRGIVSFNVAFDTLETEKVNCALPTEYQCYMFALGDNNNMYVYNPSGKTIIRVADSVIKDSVKTDEFELSLPSRFVASNDTVVCSIIKNKMTAAMFYGNMATKTSFPTVDGFDDIRKPYHSERIILKDTKNYYTIGKGIPLVQMYSSDLKQICSYSLSDVEEIARTVEEQKSDKPNSYFVVVHDAYAVNGRLYLLIASKHEGKYRCNKVLVLKTTDNSIEYEKFYELSGKVYSTLCVNGEGQVVIVNSKTAAIEIYEL